MKILIKEEQLKLIIGTSIDNTNKNFINEVTLKGISDKVRNLLNKVAVKKGKKDVTQMTTQDISAAIPSTDLQKYLGQIKSIIYPLYTLAIAGDQEQTAACRAQAKEMGVLNLMKGSADFESGKNFASDKYHIKKVSSSVDAIKDLMVRMKEDMKKDLEKSGLPAKDFDIEDAISMLYTKYNGEKSVLVKIARGIQKLVGGFSLDGRIWRVLQQEIRNLFPGDAGSLLNSVMSDFIGSVANISDDYGGKACTAYFDAIREQISYYSRAFGDQGAPNSGYEKFWNDGDLDWSIEVRCMQSCEANTQPNLLTNKQIKDRKDKIGIGSPEDNKYSSRTYKY